MNIEVRARDRAQQHQARHRRLRFPPASSRIEQMRPFLSNQWWNYLQTYGNRSRHGYAKGYAYPKIDAAGGAPRRLAAGRRLAGQRSRFLRSSISISTASTTAIMNPLSPTGQGDQNVELSVAMASAANEAQLANWTGTEPRLKASVVVPYEDGEASAAEIRKRAGNKDFAQVFMLSRTGEAHGRQALLADLRGRGRGRTAGRHPCLRL